ncbi:MAG: Uma2 family endonuclease [Armatimonadetes bacterium]|nr:Uma2 family endonuclease [Armatimonadota bacterium]
MLGPNSEPQPDMVLRLTPECGGQTVVVNHHLTGAPELVVEVAVSTEATDLGGKKRDYQGAGVQEYVVALVRHHQVVWFENRNGEFVERAPEADGVYRSRSFPGFWLDPLALLERDGPRLLEVLQQGLDSPEHAAFVTELAARRTGSASPAGP